MRNKFAGDCLCCGQRVESGAGYFQRVNRGWKVRCRMCVGRGNEQLHPDDIARLREAQQEEAF